MVYMMPSATASRSHLHPIFQVAQPHCHDLFRLNSWPSNLQSTQIFQREFQDKNWKKKIPCLLLQYLVRLFEVVNEIFSIGLKVFCLLIHLSAWNQPHPLTISYNNTLGTSPH